MNRLRRFFLQKLNPVHASASKVVFAILLVSAALSYVAISIFDGYAVANQVLLLSPTQAAGLFAAIFIAIGGMGLLLLTVAYEVARGHRYHDGNIGVDPYDRTTQFFAIVSHQLRSPLSAIRWLSEVLRSEASGKLNDNELGYIDDIHDQAKQMIRLVNALLSMTGLELKRVRIHESQVNLVGLMQSIATEHRRHSSRSLLNIVVRKPKVSIPDIRTDRDLLRQVFVNIISNAMRYSRPGRGAVEIDFVVAKEGGVVVSVKDRGIGIPAEAQNYIFEKFYRAPNAAKVQTEGSGLGLYVSKMIVDLLGGKIWFSSEEGKGTTFYVQLPKER